jgi:hypothetical protein
MQLTKSLLTSLLLAALSSALPNPADDLAPSPTQNVEATADVVGVGQGDVVSSTSMATPTGEMHADGRDICKPCRDFYWDCMAVCGRCSLSPSIGSFCSQSGE